MKKTLLFVLALIAVGCTEGEPSPKNANEAEPEPTPRNLDDLVQQGEETWLDRETMRPYSGPVFRFLPNDTTRVQLSANLKYGKMDGPLERYHDNGQLSQKSNYVAGEWHGLFEDYYSNGPLAYKGTFNMVERCGEWFSAGETVTYDPCPPGLADGN